MTAPSSSSSPARAARRFDLVLFGATGFTGQLVAEYLLRHHAAELTWAIAGRSREKLEKVRAELARIDPRAATLPILLADSHDRPALDAIARDARVVCTTVGPYALHGKDLVAACADAGTDYCDLTGEPHFVRASIDANHERAKATGARIVHCCGYDSIPSDLGTLILQRHMQEKHGAPASRVKYFAGESQGSFSGGTVASMLNIVDESTKNPAVRRTMGNPYALVPDHKGRGPDGSDQRGVRFDEDMGEWTGPFMMAAINTRVVRRTNALLGYAYGEGFRYSEAMATGKGPLGLAKATGLTAGLVGFLGAIAVPPVRRVLEKTVLPKPGEGPSKEDREAGHFTCHLVGLAEDAGLRVRAVVRGTADPGYGETAKMLGESCMCLAKDEGIATEGGVLTPASCMGMRLVERLRSAGMTFAVPVDEAWRD